MNKELLSVCLTALSVLLILCAPLVVYIIWKAVANAVDNHCCALSYRRRQLEDSSSPEYAELSKKYDFWTRLYDNFLMPTSNPLRYIGYAWSVISFTGAGLAALLVVMCLIYFPVSRSYLLNIDKEADRYEAIAPSALSTAVIREAEGLNKNIQDSFFITKNEKETVRKVDTQLMWARFFDSVGERQGKQAAVSGDLTNND